MSLTLKEQHEGEPCGDGTALYVDCGGGYTDLYT